MQVYLPVAEMAVNLFALMGLGAVAGFLSGMFGVGGGFLLTPFLIFLGVPPNVAVATQANQLVGASVSGLLGHWQRRNVDVRLGLVMLAGGTAGSLLGVLLFNLLQRLGQIDLAISILYVALLGVVGLAMVLESLVSLLWRRRAPLPLEDTAGNWRSRIPGRMYFPRSGLTISPLLPGGIGFVGGVLVAVMGIGGGFVMVPAMIYMLRMPISLVAGTSLFQILFTTAGATLLQATVNHAVDVVLAFCLLLGGVVGAQWGIRLAARVQGERARLTLGLMVGTVALKLALDLLEVPVEPFTLAPARLP